MTGRTRKAASAVLLAVTAVALTGCPRPDVNPPVRITGDREKAIPTTDPTTTTSTSTTTTTLYWGPDGPGPELATTTTTAAK